MSQQTSRAFALTRPGGSRPPAEQWPLPEMTTLPSWESFPSGDRQMLLQTLIQVARRQAPSRRRPTRPCQGR
jgi:hypothetical protein